MAAGTPRSARRARLLALSLPWLALAGCGGALPEDLPPPALPCVVAPLAQGVTTVSFDPADMLCVHLSLDDDDFDLLRQENRFAAAPEEVVDVVLAHFSDDCVTPYPARFTWFETGLRVGGVALDRVGIRKKGFLGSVVGQGLHKPSLKLKLDRNVPGQVIGDTERVTLNNNNQDPTRMQTCLAYSVFRAAGHPAPRCNLANVVRQGEALGAYTHVEAVKKRFLKRVFGKPAAGPLGSLYEGTLADFTPGHSQAFARGHLGRWDAKTSDTDTTGAPLLHLSAALQAPDSELLAALEPVLNLDRFLTFWALEVLIHHSDGYAANRNNFFVYFDPGDQGRAVFVPWGTDNVLNDDDGSEDLARYTFAELPRRLSRLAEIRERFTKELRRVLTLAWDEDALLAQVDRFAKQVTTAQEAPGYEADVERLRTWIRGRRAAVERMADKGLPAGAAAARRCTELPGGLLTDPQTTLHVLSGFAFGW